MAMTELEKRHAVYRNESETADGLVDCMCPFRGTMAEYVEHLQSLGILDRASDE